MLPLVEEEAHFWPESASQVAGEEQALARRAGCGALLRGLFWLGGFSFIKGNIPVPHGND